MRLKIYDTKKKPYEDNNESKKDYKGKEAIAMSNESEASLNNSVALGYRSKQIMMLQI